MENKELKDKELNKVNGGDNPCNNNMKCPNCGYLSYITDFSPECTESGCDRVYHYACPKCGHKWDARL